MFPEALQDNMGKSVLLYFQSFTVPQVTFPEYIFINFKLF